MICYIDRTEVPDVENIPSNVLQYLIRNAEMANDRYSRLDRYYRGEHDSIRKAPDDEVRVSVNYARYITDIILGYYLGEPVKYDANDRADRTVSAAECAVNSGAYMHWAAPIRRLTSLPYRTPMTPSRSAASTRTLARSWG